MAKTSSSSLLSKAARARRERQIRLHRATALAGLTGLIGIDLFLGGALWLAGARWAALAYGVFTVLHGGALIWAVFQLWPGVGAATVFTVGVHAAAMLADPQASSSGMILKAVQGASLALALAGAFRYSASRKEARRIEQAAGAGEEPA